MKPLFLIPSLSTYSTYSYSTEPEAKAGFEYEP